MRTGRLFAFLLTLSAIMIASCTNAKEEEVEIVDPGPTAIVVDDRTGEPIGGASAMAVWWGRSATSLFGSIGYHPERIEQTVSNEDGMIFIPDFWKKGEQPVLSVYKCGYVCWNQLYVKCRGERTDFDKENRVVNLERWPEDFSFIRHDQFIYSLVLNNQLGATRFRKVIRECETQQYLEEYRKKYGGISRTFKPAKRRIRMRTGRLLSVLLIIISAMMMTACMRGLEKEKADPGPAAIVVDDQTGEPIEGASAMAVWWGEYLHSWIEGSIGLHPMRVEQTVSDSRGRIFIPDFWKKGERPVLSVYKCGYVCWNQRHVKARRERTDFDKENRVARLERWPEDFSFIKHDRFISSLILHNRLGATDFREVIRECETQQYLEEYRKGRNYPEKYEKEQRRGKGEEDD